MLIAHASSLIPHPYLLAAQHSGLAIIPGSKFSFCLVFFHCSLGEIWLRCQASKLDITWSHLLSSVPTVSHFHHASLRALLAI
jgi:hypothetical protein